jgi:hypothetical protein
MQSRAVREQRPLTQSIGRASLRLPAIAHRRDILASFVSLPTDGPAASR